MPVYVIDTLKPKNGLDFPVVEAVDVAVEGYSSLADAVSHFATDIAIATIASNLQAQIDQIEISASAESVVAPEVAAARVGADGASYQTLKARLDSEQNQVAISENEFANEIDRVTNKLFEKETNIVAISDRSETRFYFGIRVSEGQLVELSSNFTNNLLYNIREDVTASRELLRDFSRNRWLSNFSGNILITVKNADNSSMSGYSDNDIKLSITTYTNDAISDLESKITEEQNAISRLNDVVYDYSDTETYSRSDKDTTHFYFAPQVSVGEIVSIQSDISDLEFQVKENDTPSRELLRSYSEDEWVSTYTGNLLVTVRKTDSSSLDEYTRDDILINVVTPKDKITVIENEITEVENEIEKIEDEIFRKVSRSYSRSDKDTTHFYFAPQVSVGEIVSIQSDISDLEFQVKENDTPSRELLRSYSEDEWVSTYTGNLLVTVRKTDSSSLDEYTRDDILINVSHFEPNSKYKPYAEGQQHFTVPVNQKRLYDTQETSDTQEDDSEDVVDVNCVCILPPTYTASGKPTKLMMICHGSGGGVTETTWFRDDTTVFRLFNALLDAGYAIFDCNGYKNGTEGQEIWGNERGVFAYRKAYEYMIENYNVDHNLNIYAFSMGGLTALNYCSQFNGVKALGMGAPVVSIYDTIYVDQSVQAKGDVANAYNFDSATTYDAAKIDNCDPVARIKSINETEYYINAVPTTKIWHGNSDTAVYYTHSQRLAMAIKNTGKLIYYRIVDGKGHEISYGGSNVVISEIVEFFSRFN